MIKGYKISNANEETNGIWLVDTETGDARHLTSTEPEKIWKNFLDFTNCGSILSEEVPIQVESEPTAYKENMNGRDLEIY